MVHLKNWLEANAMNPAFVLELLKKTFNIDYQINDDHVVLDSSKADQNNIIAIEAHNAVLELKTWRLLGRGLPLVRVISDGNDGVDTKGGVVHQIPKDGYFLLLFKLNGVYNYVVFDEKVDISRAFMDGVLNELSNWSTGDSPVNEYESILYVVKDGQYKIVQWQTDDSVRNLEILHSENRIATWPVDWTARWDHKNYDYYVVLPNGSAVKYDLPLDKSENSAKIENPKRKGRKNEAKL